MSQQIRFTWDNHMKNMMNAFKNLLSDGTMVDVTLACDGLSLRAHKVVLSTCSSFFQSLFSENPCKHPIVILHDVKFSELQLIIEFMYCGEIVVADDQLANVMKIAKTLMVKGLGEVMRDLDPGDDESLNQTVSSAQFPKWKKIKITKHSEIEESDLPRQSNQVPDMSDAQPQGQSQNMRAYCDSIMAATNHQIEILPVSPSKQTGDGTRKPPSHQSDDDEEASRPETKQTLSADCNTRYSVSPVPQSPQPVERCADKRFVPKDSNVSQMLKELLTSPCAPYAIILPRQSSSHNMSELSETLIQPQQAKDHTHSVPLSSTPKPPAANQQPENPPLPVAAASTSAELNEAEETKTGKTFPPAKELKSFTIYGNKVMAIKRETRASHKTNNAADEEKKTKLHEPLRRTRSTDSAKKKKADLVRDNEEITILSDEDDSDASDIGTATDSDDVRDAEKPTTSKDSRLDDTVPNVTSTREDDAIGKGKMENYKTRKTRQTAEQSRISCYKCKVCNKPLSSLSTLIKHVKNMHKLFCCSVCRFCCKFRLQLNMHKVKEHGIKKCNACSFTNTSDTVLTRHMWKVHNEYKPLYKCLECDYCCSFKNNLEKHIVETHLNGKKLESSAEMRGLFTMKTVLLENGTKK